MSRTGKAMGTVGEPADYRQIRLSPDQKRVALSGVGSRLFTLDLGSRITSGLTFNDDSLSSLSDPVWRPDGRALAFRAQRNGKVASYQQILGTRDVTVLESPDLRGGLSDWSPDGRFLLFQTPPPSELYATPLSGDPKPVLLAKSQKAIDSPHFSPDGKWVSYSTYESGTWETWVASFPALDNRQQMSSRGGGQARWRADGKELFYLTPDGQMMSVVIESDPKTGALRRARGSVAPCGVSSLVQPLDDSRSCRINRRARSESRLRRRDPPVHQGKAPSVVLQRPAPEVEGHRLAPGSDAEIWGSV